MAFLPKPCPWGDAHEQDRPHSRNIRQSGEIIIDDRFVAVASCDGSLQIVGDDSRRNTFKILNGILACLYQVFLALRPYGFAVGIMAERKDGNKYLGFLRLARHFINNFKSVTGKVNIHLLCGIVLYMTDKP